MLSGSRALRREACTSVPCASSDQAHTREEVSGFLTKNGYAEDVVQSCTKARDVKAAIEHLERLCSRVLGDARTSLAEIRPTGKGISGSTSGSLLPLPFYPLLLIYYITL